MRVLGIVSSPRKGGNSELAVKEILKTLPDSWEKSMVNINKLNISNCTACYACVPEGSKCRLTDDLDFFIRMVKHSDKVVIAAPAYMLGGHTMVKRVLDRLISIVSDYPSFHPSDCVLALFNGYAGWEGLVKEELLMFAKKLHLNVIGTEVMLATLPGDSVKGKNLEKLHTLAALLETGGTEKPAPTSEALECPFCSSTALHINPDGSIRCALCAGTGRLTQGEHGFQIEYDPMDTRNHFTHKSLDAHTDYLIEKKQLFLDTRKEIQALQAKYADLDWWVTPEDKKK